MATTAKRGKNLDRRKKNKEKEKKLSENKRPTAKAAQREGVTSGSEHRAPAESSRLASVWRMTRWGLMIAVIESRAALRFLLAAPLATGSDDSLGRLAIADGWRFLQFFFHIYEHLIFESCVFVFQRFFFLAVRLVGLWSAFGGFGAGNSSVNNWDEV